MTSSKWINGLPDYHLERDHVRLQVKQWHVLSPVHGLYFEQPRSVRRVWNYLKEVGIRNTLRKVRSRFAERSRNDKYLACGVATVLASPVDSNLKEGDTVIFVAPCHPQCVERIVLPPMLVRKVASAEFPFCNGKGVTLHTSHDAADDATYDAYPWQQLTGWSSYSGVSLSDRTCSAALDLVHRKLHEGNHGVMTAPADGESSGVNEVLAGTGHHRARSSRPHAVLFGYGHYAKNMLLPRVKDYMDVVCIHEIDPQQIPAPTDQRIRWDSSPHARDDEDYDVYLIAGYHHTHAGLVEHALSRGAAAVVEKPLAVSSAQLKSVLRVMTETDGSMFVAFNRRYLPFNQYIRSDMGVSQSDPMSYHCIVYEVPLPPRHWYRWPNSQDRIVSNGCHWIDHFLFLNNYCDVSSHSISVGACGTVNCTATLTNGALFTMVLTDVGSPRIGMQDYVEIRCRDATAKIVNGVRYRVERGDRIVRKRRASKYAAYDAMYTSIAKRILRGEKGDSPRSTQASAALMLAMSHDFALCRDAHQPASVTALARSDDALPNLGTTILR